MYICLFTLCIHHVLYIALLVYYSYCIYTHIYTSVRAVQYYASKVVPIDENSCRLHMVTWGEMCDNYRYYYILCRVYSIDVVYRCIYTTIHALLLCYILLLLLIITLLIILTPSPTPSSSTFQHIH